MGQLLAKLQSDPNPLEVFVDFENSKPASPEEQEIFGRVEPLLERSVDILRRIEVYGKVEGEGCGELIRKAINQPNEETQNAAWTAVLPMVDQLRVFYEYSTALEQAIPDILRALCKASPDAETALMNNQALTRQLATIFEFVLRFDDSKMTNPAIQNDFSYYRRSLNKMKMQNGAAVEVPIKDELANKMSLFYAYPTPMMKCLSETTVSFVEANPAIPREQITGLFAMMANACYSMVATKKLQSEKGNMFCLRAMTAAIIVFDHADTVGAFAKKSPIHIRGAIKTLKDFPASLKSDIDGLINALRFTSVHLNDDDTPNAVKNLLQ